MSGTVSRRATPVASPGERDHSPARLPGARAKIVARYLDNRILKGYSLNFDPKETVFALAACDAPPDDEPVLVRLEDLKAVFFVRDFDGNP